MYDIKVDIVFGVQILSSKSFFPIQNEQNQKIYAFVIYLVLQMLLDESCRCMKENILKSLFTANK